jgi:putative FmdB family regulatory protein
MPTYSYRCDACGAFAQTLPMAAVTDTATCPACDRPARRVFAAPGLRSLDAGMRRAFDASARSASEPTVVSSVPGRSRRATPVSNDPRHARLPRP